MTKQWLPSKFKINILEPTYRLFNKLLFCSFWLFWHILTVISQISVLFSSHTSLFFNYMLLCHSNLKLNSLFAAAMSLTSPLFKLCHSGFFTILTMSLSNSNLIFIYWLKVVFVHFSLQISPKKDRRSYKIVGGDPEPPSCHIADEDYLS